MCSTDNELFEPQDVHVDTWVECKEKLQELALRRGVFLRDHADDDSFMGISPLFYRGQANSSWKLETTLERYAGLMPLEDYFLLALKTAPQIESYTDRAWSIPPREDFDSWLKSVDFLLTSKVFAQDYLAYLRHHGFPSPLLDWTRSPYVAAYFAFEAPQGQNVSIYSFMEYGGEGKSHFGQAEIITHLSAQVRTHRRHFVQQSEYTICTQGKGVLAQFASHETVFARKVQNQDLLWKITVPASERLKVLRDLELMNINRYTLFGTEEALMSTMALRQFYPID